MMPKFKARQKLVQKVIQLYWEEFDTEDQEQWDSLRNRIEDDLSEFPEEAPSDPNVWFQLFQNLYYAEYENAEEDYWVSDIKGFTEYSYELVDSDNNVIDSA
jgi:hypothetical protein